MSIAINSNFERDQITATVAGQTVFTYSFPIFDETFITVYKRAGTAMPNDQTQKLTLGVDYSVQQVGEAAGGTITLVVGAAIGDIITMVGTQPIERESIFADLNPFTVALNEQLNEQTVMAQQTFTLLENITPAYNRNELVSTRSVPSPTGVRPDKLILPMLPNGYVWMGRGEIGQNPDDIIAVPLPGGTPVVPVNPVPIVVPGNTFQVGDWLAIDTAGNYVLALADQPADAEVVGVVITIEVPGNTFFIQQTGYINQAGAVFAGLTPGTVYFLSTVNPGQMVTTDATVNGQVSKPLFITDTDSSGWVLDYRGLIVGGVNPPPAPPGPPIIIPIPTPTAGLAVGMFIYVSASQTYLPCLATSLATSQAVGCIIEIIDANNLLLQIDGYNVGAITQDDLGAPITAASVYYLSTTVPGSITKIAPNNAGQFNRPAYTSEQVAGTTGTDAGFILPQRPLDLSGSNSNIVVITFPGHGFVAGDWVYISGNNTYAKGIATALATSQIAGVVTAVPTVNTFVLQQAGYITGVVTVDDAAAPIVSGVMYYLSPTVAGRLTTTLSVTVGQVTKPCYVQQTLASNYGEIHPERPLLVTSSGGGGGTVVQSISSYVTKQNTSCFGSTANGWVALVDAVTGPGFPNLFSITITPTSVANSIRITANVLSANTGSFAGTGIPFGIIRNPTVNASHEITAGTLVGSGIIPGGALEGCIINVLDAPATVAATTYIIGTANSVVGNPGASFFVNPIGSYSGNPFIASNKYTSFIQCEEIT